MIFRMMRQYKNNGISTLNPSTIANDLSKTVFFKLYIDITRRRIYDIIHVFSCLKLITRITYCEYSWNGINAMQEYLTQLYTIPVKYISSFSYTSLNNLILFVRRIFLLVKNKNLSIFLSSHFFL